MSNITTHKRTDEEENFADDYDGELIDEELYEDEEEEVEAVSTTISDSRARRKRNRGELVEPLGAPTTEKKDRPTPGRRINRTANAPSPITTFIEKIPIIRTVYRVLFLGLYNYFNSAISEMRKVTWPTREETRRLTWLVLTVTVVFSIALGLLDLFYGWWFRQALDNDIIFLVVAALVTVLGAALTWFIFLREEEYSPF